MKFGISSYTFTWAMGIKSYSYTTVMNHYDLKRIFFLSDHGDMLGQRGMVQKRVLYDHSARIPLVINMPEKYQAGTRGSVVTEPVSLTDVAGKSECKDIENELQKIILSNFDFEELDKQAQQSFEKRKEIKESRKVANPPSWNYNPDSGVDTLYWR